MAGKEPVSTQPLSCVFWQNKVQTLVDGGTESLAFYNRVWLHTFCF